MACPRARRGKISPTSSHEMGPNDTCVGRRTRKVCSGNPTAPTVCRDMAAAPPAACPGLGLPRRPSRRPRTRSLLQGAPRTWYAPTYNSSAPADTQAEGRKPASSCGPPSDCARPSASSAATMPDAPPSSSGRRPHRSTCTQRARRRRPPPLAVRSRCHGVHPAVVRLEARARCVIMFRSVEGSPKGRRSHVGWCRTSDTSTSVAAAADLRDGDQRHEQLEGPQQHGHACAAPHAHARIGAGHRATRAGARKREGAA